jgi:hypothetical protein
MYVQVRHALANLVIDTDEGALRAHGRLHRPAQNLDVGQESPVFGRGQLGQGLDMGSGDEQHMTREDRPMIKERDGIRILEHYGGGDARVRNFTEDTRHVIFA